MSRRLLILFALVVGLVLASGSVASASDNWGGYGTKKSASAHTGSGSVTVGAGIYRHRHPSAPSTTTEPTTTTTDPTTTDPPSTTVPVPTTVCALLPINLVEFQNLLGIGGPTPGYWAFDQCTGPGGSYAKGPPVWVVSGPPANGTPAPAAPPAANPPPSPVAVAQQAASTLTLPLPVIEMAPPAGAEQLVRVETWLWVNPDAWQPSTVTATVDGVAASATATPEAVVWKMGDGSTITCDGPGTPYDASEPNATTSCFYTWSTPSDSQSSGTYQVTATIEFAVTWTAIGAPGGGNLGLVAGATATDQVRVGESEALNGQTNGPA